MGRWTCAWDKRAKRRTTLINAASVDQLTFIFKQYGEERFARKMANAIVKERVNAF